MVVRVVDNLQRRDFLKACMAAAGAAAVGSLTAGCATEPGNQTNAFMELTDNTTSESSGGRLRSAIEFIPCHGGEDSAGVGWWLS